MTTSKHIVSAATIVLNDQKEILLIKGPRRGWEMPGGQVTLSFTLPFYTLLLFGCQS